MAWISWSRLWATRRTTTTSRKLLRWSSKISRWRRMYLLLRADKRPKQNHEDGLLSAHLPICERSWTDIEPETHSHIAYPVSKRLSTLLRHGHLPREEDGAIEFWRLKDDLRNKFEYSQHWSDEMWVSRMAGGGGNKKKIQHRNDPSGQEMLLSPSSSRSFKTQSHWSFITGQCVNSEQFLRVHSSHRMRNQFTFHHKFRIDTGRTKIEQKTDGFPYVCGSYEQGIQRSEYSRPESTASCMVSADSLEETSKCVFGRHKTCSTERI